MKGISGVVLFRPTMSRIICKQQIDRALTSGDGAAPLILDVVNNFEGLYSISASQKEMEQAIAYMRQNGEEERFKVEEQVHDCAKLFEQIQNSLSTPWSHYFREAKKFYKENNHLNVPKNYDTSEGLHLDQRICTQRVLYRNSHYCLTQANPVIGIHRHAVGAPQRHPLDAGL